MGISWSQDNSFYKNPFNPDLVGPVGWLYMVLPRIVFLVDIPFSLMTDGLYTEGGIFLIKFLL